MCVRPFWWTHRTKLKWQIQSVQLFLVSWSDWLVAEAQPCNHCGHRRCWDTNMSWLDAETMEGIWLAGFECEVCFFYFSPSKCFRALSQTEVTSKCHTHIKKFHVTCWANAAFTKTTAVTSAWPSGSQPQHTQLSQCHCCYLWPLKVCFHLVCPYPSGLCVRRTLP